MRECPTVAHLHWQDDDMAFCDFDLRGAAARARPRLAGAGGLRILRASCAFYGLAPLHSCCVTVCDGLCDRF